MNRVGIAAAMLLALVAAPLSPSLAALKLEEEVAPAPGPGRAAGSAPAPAARRLPARGPSRPPPRSLPMPAHRALRWTNRRSRVGRVAFSDARSAVQGVDLGSAAGGEHLMVGPVPQRRGRRRRAVAPPDG